MRSILEQFEITKNKFKKSDNHDERKNRRLKYFQPSVYDSIPKLSFPAVNTNQFDADFKEVCRCHSSPSLQTRFLKGTEDSIESFYKDYFKESDVKRIDWKVIHDILEDVDTIVLNLKHQYDRPRPIHFFDDASDLSIKYKKSPSYPSGHTTIAYFLCDLLSHYIPEARQDMQTLAALIGQSRVENAVHFPTDVEFGRLVGETLADVFLNEEEVKINKTIKNKHRKNLVNHIVDINSKNLVDDLAYFLFRTNQIEMYDIPYGHCENAAKDFVNGYPVDYCTSNPHIKSQLNAMIGCHKVGKIDNSYKIRYVHELFDPVVIERGVPGEVRSYPHMSRSGVKFAESNEILECLKNLHKINIDPWDKHICYEWIHPFCDGNGRSGRIFLLSDLNFDFSKVNELIDDSYLERLIPDISDNLENIKKLLKM